MKKITHHLGRFSTFFKESSLVIQLVIVASAIGLIAGTATVTAMVATPNNEIASTDSAASDSNDTTSQPSTSNDSGQPADTSTDTPATATPQASQATPQNNTTQNSPQGSTNSSQQEPQTQTPVQPIYTDTYPFEAECVANPQYTSTQIDTLSYTKCFSASYTAYKVAQTFGTMPQYWGDPAQWPARADNATISRGTTPKLHSVGIQTTGGAGWSVWVEAVHEDNTIDISYYNFNNSLAYGTQYNVNPAVFSTYIYFGE